ncbi:Actin-related protein 2/3 complex subunitA [Sesamum angolense]|uniref:Arp2/3 complex 34 kDa subunit n=1 Tax=Sesamum angolense TaxID=2727404 RepID=A0AAE1X984_9LAMI|nr:Actin-related protein 2/3 complex subunitA [Sesamum angolense]
MCQKMVDFHFELQEETASYFQSLYAMVFVGSQATVKNPNILLLSLSLPTPPPETVFSGGLPQGAIEAIKAAYGVVLQILDPPRDGFNLTLKLNLSKLPPDEEHKQALLVKIASIREVVLGAPLRAVLKQLVSRGVKSNLNKLLSLVHRPNESFFVVPQADKVTVIFPMRFKDSIDTVLATSFLQEFVEARRAAGLGNAPPCLWSSSPPQELKGAPEKALSANAGFVSFEQSFSLATWKVERWTGLFGVYQHFMHMSAIMSRSKTPEKENKTSPLRDNPVALDRAKPDLEKADQPAQNRSFKRLDDTFHALFSVEVKGDMAGFRLRLVSNPFGVFDLFSDMGRRTVQSRTWKWTAAAAEHGLSWVSRREEAGSVGRKEIWKK